MSVTALEALYASKIIRRRGGQAVAKVRAAHLETKEYAYGVRDQHPHPCSMLERDTCSIYEFRPEACRMAVSLDASICARSYHNITDEEIPTPVSYLMGRAAYAIALACALKHAQLPVFAYEFNAALTRAIEIDNAERAWLAGEDIFANVLREPTDPFASPPAKMMYRYAFDNIDG
jgi:hypothetical protein